MLMRRPERSLRRSDDGTTGPRVACVGPACLAIQGVLCRLCSERCLQQAIRFHSALGGYALPRVEADLCDGCGLCVEACPVQAISLVDRPPAFESAETAKAQGSGRKRS